MNKSVKKILLFVAILVLWTILALLNAGPAGLGVILALLALLDSTTGTFEAGNKIAWIMVSLTALLLAILGIGSTYVIPAETQGKTTVYALTTGLAILLPLAYFLVGRRQKIAMEK
ncbi:MAG: hypothetical protein PHC98_09300 [Syntrophotalea acetylenica]|jgi:hypothetical protein|uniref:Uncharacterized protein n=2 Tax=Syntrophotalea TaxID=2812025 RepID=A0A1L3GFV4_SYNAC|nr:hypothetical protein [Syntrophotalea acetylenica]APG24833.1 hypothetical protein A7E75_07205 [Syntrophotalea acetylenica]APG42893.1 hypothetical protein A6070_01165 [Syntrophotalea acetylenica]MDD4457760.1 hypothetical protein [Syntrophotalea acetylenica]MDY0261355.1 hypothetical protein [Syntrophotalea acetylenica]